jgi:hypothetical protein
MAAMVRASADEEDWAEVERLEQAFASLALAAQESEGPAPLPFYRALQRNTGLPGRTWYKNPLWAPGLETGYAAEMLPTLRLAASEGEEAFERELDALVESVDALTQAWRSSSPDTGQ